MSTAQSQAERAYDQVVEWLDHFEALDDPRQSGKVWYPLDEVLLLCLLAVLAGAECWVEIAEFGKAKIGTKPPCSMTTQHLVPFSRHMRATMNNCKVQT